MIESKLLENGISRIAGVDEAGRGACAGPLVIAAVILKDLTSNIWSGIRDSKELSAAQREEQFKLIVNGALEYSIIEIEADRKSTRLNSSHVSESRMPSSA